MTYFLTMTKQQWVTPSGKTSPRTHQLMGPRPHLPTENEIMKLFRCEVFKDSDQDGNGICNALLLSLTNISSNLLILCFI